MQSFLELGLSDAIAGAARAAGYERPTPLQVAGVPVLRRGGNVLLHASSGSGVTAAFGLPLLDRLTQDGAAEGGGTRAIVLTATVDRAAAVAHALAGLSGDTGLKVRASAPGWRSASADVLVLTPADALREVEASSLKLEHVRTLVVTDAADILEMGGGDTLGTLASLMPSDAQRVVTTGSLNADVEKFIDAQARRALTVPARAADPKASAPTEPTGQIGYMVVAESDKPEMLARLLEGSDEALVHARTAARAEMVLRELSRRGVTDGDGPRVRTASFDAEVEGAARIVSYDVPFDADELRGLHETGGTVLVTAAELTHFRRIAAEAGFTAKHRRARVLDESEVATFRAMVETAVAQEDLSAQLLILDPLFETHSAAAVAAALSALLRRRTPHAPAAPAATATAATGSVPKEAVTGAFTRLFISIGTRDNIRPGDLVGAITGEAGIKGEQVGRVDIRDSFSVVEVAGTVAEKVIRALNGTTMRGRSLRVDFDRKVGGDSGGRDEARGGTSRPRGSGPARGPGGAGGRGPRSGGGGPRDRGDGPPSRRPAGRPPGRRSD